MAENNQFTEDLDKEGLKLGLGLLVRLLVLVLLGNWLFGDWVVVVVFTVIGFFVMRSLARSTTLSPGLKKLLVGRTQRHQLLFRGRDPEKRGASTDERRAAINAKFDSKRGEESHEILWTPDGTDKKQSRYMRFEVKRNLSAMDDRERETLRMLRLLQNEGLLQGVYSSYYGDVKTSLDRYDWLVFSLLWGDGKAETTGEWKVYSKMGDPAGIKEQLEDIGVQDKINPVVERVAGILQIKEEAGISYALNLFDKIEQENPKHPVVVLLRQRLSGGNRLLDDRELENTIFYEKTPASLKLGELEGGVEFQYSGEGSLFTVAPPGSGKTQCHVLPNLLNYPGPVVVLDVKGECYEATANWRQQNIGPVHRFEPLKPDNSAHYNPLLAVRDDPEHVWEDARYLAEMVIVPEDASDPSWENRARDVVTAGIAWAAMTKPSVERNMGVVIDLINKIGWKEFVDELCMSFEVPPMRRLGNSLADMPEKQLEGVLDAGRRHLSVWEGAKIERITSRSDWTPAVLRESPCHSVYICIPPGQIETYAGLLRVVIAQHIRGLTEELPPRGQLPILFMLDELPRLGQMAPVKEALEVGRQYGIRLWMFAQSLGQMESAYDNAEGMVGSCAVRVFMNPSLHDGTAQKISEDLGYMESALDGKRKAVLEPSDLAGPDFKDKQIVFGFNSRPAIVQKCFAYADPELQAKRAG